MTDSTRALASRIAALEAWQRNRASQLAYSAIEAGAINEYDLDGNQTGQYGRQHDGTSGATVLISPPPPVPTNPAVVDGIFGATVKWDGLFVGAGVVAPMDFKGVEIVAGPVGFDIASTPPFSTITSARGGEIFVPLEAGTFEVVLVTRTLAGRPSDPSGRVVVHSAPAVTDAELAQIEADVAAIPAQIQAGMDEATANAVDLAQLNINTAQAAAAVDAQTKATAAQQAAIAAAATDAQTKANAAQAAAVAAAALTAQQKADLAQAAALAGAATDAQAKANAAQQAAITAAATDAQTKATQAKTDAIASAATGAQAKADAAQAAAIAAAATDAQAKATAAQQAAITAAATDAQTKANTAQTAAINAAATAAQAKADAAQAAAIAAAATDAQTKATAAQQAAITAAATDAQTKANTAQTAAISAAATTAQQKADLAQAAAIAQAALITNKVNNPTRTGTTDGWVTTGAAATLVAEDVDFNGTTIRALKFSTAGNSTLESGIFDIDPTKAYEYRLWVLDPTDVAGATQFYAGSYFYNVSTVQRSVTPHGAVSGNPSGPTANFYGAQFSPSTPAWKEVVFWALPNNATIPTDTQGLGTNAVYNALLTTDSVKAKFRVLNWLNTGTVRDLWVANMTVREMPLSMVRNSLATEAWRYNGTVTMDGGKIAADSVTATQILAGSIVAGKIAANAVLAANIKAGEIQAGHLSASSVIAGNIAANAVTSATIAAGAITAGKILAGSVTATELAADSVTAVKILAGEVVAGKIAAGAVTAGNVAANAIVAGNIAANAVTAGTVAANAITAATIAAGAVTTAKILAGNVTATEIATDAITAVKILAGAISAGKLAANSVIAGNIATDAVTAGTVAAGAITAGKIATDAVTAGTIAAGAVVAGKIGALAVTAGTIDVGAVTATTIAAGAVIAGSFAADSVLAANVKAGEIQAGALAVGAVLAGTIAANAVTSATIATGAITTAKILAGNVTATEIATDAITAVKIQAGAVIAGKLAANSVTASNISAYAIGVQHLAVGSLVNQVPGGAGEFGSLVGTIFEGVAGVTFSTTTPPAGVSGYFVCSTGTKTGSAADTWDVEPGSEYLVEMWVKASVAGSRMVIGFRDQSNAVAGPSVAASDGSPFLGNASYPLAQIGDIPTAWTKYTSVVTMNATASKVRVNAVYFNHPSGTVTTATQNVAIRIRPRAAGRLVVDGSITANQLAALAVTAGKVAANAIVAGNIATDAVQANAIAAGQITAGKLAANAVIAGNIAAGAITASTIAAGAIDGQTITGALFQTASSGARLRIAPNAYDPLNNPHTIEWVDPPPAGIGNSINHVPNINSRYLTGGKQYTMQLSAGSLDSGHEAYLSISSGASDNTLPSYVYINGDQTRVTGTFGVGGGALAGTVAVQRQAPATQTVATATWTTLFHSTNIYAVEDGGVMYSGGTWTAKFAGIYTVQSSVTFPVGAGSHRMARIASPSGSTVFAVGYLPQSAATRCVNVSWTGYLNAGAQISTQAYHDMGATATMPIHTNPDPQTMSMVRHLS